MDVCDDDVSIEHRHVNNLHSIGVENRKHQAIPVVGILLLSNYH